MITIDELEKQLSEARKGKAKIDSKYVGNAEGLPHIFDYNIDYIKFISNIFYIIKEIKENNE
jgi:hypothetical protein